MFISVVLGSCGDLEVMVVVVDLIDFCRVVVGIGGLGVSVNGSC